MKSNKIRLGSEEKTQLVIGVKINSFCVFNHFLLIRLTFCNEEMILTLSNCEKR